MLFISDTHLGRKDDREQVTESSLITFLRAQEDAVSHLYLLGDIFDQYIEYRYLVPKGYVRLLALLAEWSEQGIPITYLVGNHDPWHLDYFERELGIRVVSDVCLEPLFGRNVYIRHGDGIDPDERVYRMLKPLLRHRVPVWLYRTILPGDAGMALAGWVRRTLGDEEIKDSKIHALRAYAHRVVEKAQADIVVMGHTHFPELIDFPEGRYLNPGSWRYTRTYGRLDENGLELLYWNGTCSKKVGVGNTG